MIKMNRLLYFVMLIGSIFPVSGQVYHVGDLYTAEDGSQGIVYYIHRDGSGWIVALNDVSHNAVWGIQGEDVPGISNTGQSIDYYTNCLNDTAGYANTNALRAYQNSNPNFAAGMVDFDHGWYIPSAAQLTMLFAQLPFIEGKIIAAGGTTLAYDYYMSSTEVNDIQCVRVHFTADSINYFYITYSGSFFYHLKNEPISLRAVRSLHPLQNTYDTTLTYSWSNGSTEPHFQDIPQQTTTYTVTVSTEYGCTNTASVDVIVIDNNPQVIYDTVCQGSTYNNNGFTLSSQETAEAGELVRTHTVSAADCESEVTLFLTVVPHDTVHIEQTANESFVWNGVTYDESGTYTQYFNNQNGCDSTVVLTLTLDGGDDPGPGFDPDTIPFGEGDTLMIYLPNAITPTRDDGLNDCFYLPDEYKPLISDFKIEIFNRWGTVVYRATDKNFRWDGSINGKIYFNVVYRYLIFFEDIIGRPYILKGTITVL